jgi:predicted pyridoxine 5'-phosphate oxidase superfamily flavin-nucleotide-binding protein
VNGPFHEGEIQIQREAGEEKIGTMNGAIISKRIMSGALPFLRQQAFVVIGSRSNDQSLWCSVVFGFPGFLSSDDGYSLTIDRTGLGIQVNDPLWENIDLDAAVGLLVIDLRSRRRLRVNGTISRLTPEEIVLSVAEAYPNCPKYITRRDLRVSQARHVLPLAASTGVQLGEDQMALFNRADMLFLATAHPTAGLDASHRGGPAGFVEVAGPHTLRIPDYPGNGMFNSLGNLAVDPRIGLAVIDLERRRSLQVTGTAAIEFGVQDPTNRSGGTNRFIKVNIDRWIELPLLVGLKAEFLDYSPFNPASRT